MRVHECTLTLITKCRNNSGRGICTDLKYTQHNNLKDYKWNFSDGEGLLSYFRCLLLIDHIIHRFQNHLYPLCFFIKMCIEVMSRVTLISALFVYMNNLTLNSNITCLSFLLSLSW